MRSSAAWPQSLARLSTGLDDAAAGTGEARYTLQQVMQWSEQRVCQWVQEQGFAKYAGAFREQQVNGEALVELDYGLLKELSVRTVGERVRLNLAIRRLRQQCLQTDARNASHGRSSRSATLDSVSGPSAFAVHAGADTVASPGPLSAASMGTAAGAEPSTAGTFGLVSALPGSAGSRKELPILPRASMSFNSIGLSDIGESVSGSGGGGGGGAGSARPNGNSSVLHRANTDTHTFGARDQRAPDHTSVLASATVRKPKTATAPGQPHRLPNPLLSTPPHKPAAVQPLVPLSAPVPRQRAPLAVASQPSLRRGPHRTTKAVSPAPVLSSAAGSSASVSPSPSARRLPPLRELRTEHGGDIERLGFQLQEFFGTDISVAHLADSLSVRTWQITVAGPENRVRQVQIANTNSATAILDRVRRAFGLDSDIDGDQYSLFSMTSEGGGARCLSNEELARMFADPDSTPPEKFFLRKRHQLSRPPIGLKRYEHLQRAIERLGNIIPSTPPPPPPLLASTVSLPQQLLQRPSTKWESTTEKLTKILGERPPSELVSLNVEKYFPGNEARARHSIMRRRKNESQEAAAAAAAAATGTGPDGHDSVGRSSRRQSRANRRASRTSVRTMQSRIRSLTLGSDERLSGFSNNLEPIKESLQSPAMPAAAVPAPPLAPPQAAPAAPPASARVPASGVPALPAASWGARTRQPQAANSAGATPQIAEATVPAAPAVDASASDSGDGLPSKARVTSLPLASPSGSCASLQYSDDDDLRSGSDDDNNMGTLSDLSDSDLSDSFDDSSFCKSLGDSDIDGDEDLATYDSALRTGDDSADGAAGAGAGASAAEDSAAAGAAAKGADADERRLSTAQSVGGGSRSGRGHGKKKTWIKGAPIASGSFGSVYFGMNTRTGVIMAVKEVDLPKPGSVSMSRNQRMADALRHELDLLKGLDHRNVVKYLGTDMDDVHLYIFLEYVSGGSVSSALASFGMFPESLVRTYTGQIIEGLVYLHEQGIIHRDIKGGNVLIDQDGSVKISDFGISKRVDEVVVAAVSKAGRRASLQGSVFWMAPEVVKDTQYTVKGDVWSLGCLVIEMMTGTHPFPELDQMQALYTIGQRGRPQIPDGISPTGQDFLEQALQVDLDMRPTAKDLAPHAFVCTEDDPPSPSP